MKTTFKTFKIIVLVLVTFEDDLELDEIHNLINEWYVIYKESLYDDVVEFITQQQLPEDEVSKDTHPFWVSSRGLKLLQ